MGISYDLQYNKSLGVTILQWMIVSKNQSNLISSGNSGQVAAIPQIAMENPHLPGLNAISEHGPGGVTLL